MQVEGTRLYRVKAVAESLDVSVHTIYRAIADGRLDALRIGKSVRITESALSAFLSACGEDAHQAFVIDGQAVDQTDVSGVSA